MTDVTLAVETSGFEGSIALRLGGVPVEECVLERRRHAQTLISQVRALLENHQLEPQSVGLIAVSHGPGSFTGLRVGVVFAKTFAFATGCGLVAVDTLQAVAARAPEGIDRISVVSDAQREQLFVGDYSRSSCGQWDPAEAVQIMGVEAWSDWAAAQHGAGFAVSGPGLARVAERLPETVNALPDTFWNPRALQIASLGEELAAGGEFADPVSLEPFYLRLSSAEDKRDARKAEAAKGHVQQ